MVIAQNNGEPENIVSFYCYPPAHKPAIINYYRLLTCSPALCFIDSASAVRLERMRRNRDENIISFIKLRNLRCRKSVGFKTVPLL